MKETFYFSHDYNARTDAKIKNLIRKHGFMGYGIFWAIIEDLYNNANALQTDCEGIAFDLHSDKETIYSILHDFDLFVFEGDTFGSLSVQRRILERDEKSNKARESAFKRWNKDAKAMRTHSEGNAIKDSIVKEKKESKVNIPALDEFLKYGIENSTQNHKSAIELKYKAWFEAGWKDGHGKKIKNWKSKLLNTIPHLKPENAGFWPSVEKKQPSPITNPLPQNYDTDHF